MTRNRIFVLLWLLVSQLGGGVLVLVPITLMGMLALLTMAGGGIPMLFVYLCGAIFIPVIFALSAWIAFLRKKDKAAVILSSICLFIEASLYIALKVFDYPFPV